MDTYVDLDMTGAHLLKVIRVCETGSVHARTVGGAIDTFSYNPGSGLPEVGDILLRAENQVRPAPADLWPKTDTQIGVVIKIPTDGRLLVRVNYLPHFIPDSGIEVSEGNVVEFTPEDGVLSVLAERPFKRDDDYLLSTLDIDAYRIAAEDGALSFDDFGGYPEIVKRAQELIETQIGKRDRLRAIGATPVKGVLFTGPPGTGKTFLAKVIANTTDADFFLVSGPEIVGKWVGESEERLRQIFEAAESSAKRKAIIFFDEIDSIAERRTDHNHEASRRLVAQFLTLMDGFSDGDASVIVIAATNRVEALDPALTRPGRFDWRIRFTQPRRADRIEILTVGARRVATHGVLPIEDIAQRTENWSAADLNALWTEAALIAANADRDLIAGEDLVQALERITNRRQVGHKRGQSRV